MSDVVQDERDLGQFNLDQRTVRLLGGVRMVATLGHSCGLVDPYNGDATQYSPMLAILERLAEVDPWLVETWEYRKALARVRGDRAY